MRITLIFRAQKGLYLPVHYNYLVQSFIYRSIGEALARFYHQEGYCFGKRCFKLFTFSRLLGGRRKFFRDRGEICFEGRVRLKIGAVDNRLFEDLATYLVKTRYFRLGRNYCELEAVEVEMPVFPEGPVTIRALSPITVYVTEIENGRRKMHFYTPHEKGFSEGILENLKRKMGAYLGRKEDLPPLDGAYIHPVCIGPRDLVVAKYKNYFWIKGWLGTYRLYLPRPYFELAYAAGLGAKNSQGFGMIEVVEKEER